MYSNSPSISLNGQIIVTTSARLHMGFFDLTARAESRFGGLGLAIDAPCTQVQISESNNLMIEAESSESAADIVEKLIHAFNLPKNISIKVLQHIPQHAGLGSGTQLALAIGAGVNQLLGLNLSIAEIAKATMRGKRSGIGIGAFAQGGFVLDSGKPSNKPGEIPAITARYTFPNDWRVLLVLDAAHTGVHGAVESEAFQKLNPASNSTQSMVVEHLLPALQRADLLAFGAYMADLQAYNGDYFAPIQGGRYASKDVAQVLDWLQSHGVTCAGQSSWGPTGFAILETQQQAETMQRQARLAFANKPNISFNIVRGKNTGATVSELSVNESK